VVRLSSLRPFVHPTFFLEPEPEAASGEAEAEAEAEAEVETGKVRLGLGSFTRCPRRRSDP
jgi:hypothetical protein